MIRSADLVLGWLEGNGEDAGKSTSWMYECGVCVGILRAMQLGLVRVCTEGRVRLYTGCVLSIGPRAPAAMCVPAHTYTHLYQLRIQSLPTHTPKKQKETKRNKQTNKQTRTNQRTVHRPSQREGRASTAIADRLRAYERREARNLARVLKRPPFCPRCLSNQSPVVQLMPLSLDRRSRARPPPSCSIDRCGRRRALLGNFLGGRRRALRDARRGCSARRGHAPLLALAHGRRAAFGRRCQHKVV